MIHVEYDISTGSKEEFYTLWKTIYVDLRPRDQDGNILEVFKPNAIGGNMYYHVHIKFVQNLAKTKEQAMEKAKELGINLPETDFDFDLKNYSKPSFEAFGVKMKFKGEKWYAKATKEFWDAWRANRQEMQSLGWSCWKHGSDWYMAVRPQD